MATVSKNAPGVLWKLIVFIDLIPLYHKWFVARLPTGERLGVALSPQLEESFKVFDASQ
jgi:hypothetical protein